MEKFVVSGWINSKLSGLILWTCDLTHKNNRVKQKGGDKGNPFTIVADDIGAYYEVIVHLRQNV